jgi:hypothetical protein
MGFAWVICWFEEDIPLRTELVTDYGLKEDHLPRAKPQDTEQGKIVVI